jgi:hypothetical protein
VKRAVLLAGHRTQLKPAPKKPSVVKINNSQYHVMLRNTNAGLVVNIVPPQDKGKSRKDTVNAVKQTRKGGPLLNFGINHAENDRKSRVDDIDIKEGQKNRMS